MVDSRIWLFTRPHGLKPIHQMAHIVVVRTERVGRFRPRNLQHCCAVGGRPYQWRLFINRTRLPGIEFPSSAFFSCDEERCTLSTIVLDGSISAENPRKAPVAVAESRLVHVQKPAWICDRRYARVGIFAVIFPYKNTPIGDDTHRMRLVCPKVDEVATVTEPLVKDSGGEIFIEPELKVNVRIEGPVWFAQEPALPVRVFLAQLRFAPIHPALPLHLFVLQHFWRDARVHTYKTPALLVDIPLLLDLDYAADLPRANDVSNGQRVSLA